MRASEALFIQGVLAYRGEGDGCAPLRQTLCTSEMSDGRSS
jgi:hypothetical protein